jgi:hypothetical protein
MIASVTGGKTRENGKLRNPAPLFNSSNVNLLFPGMSNIIANGPAPKPERKKFRMCPADTNDQAPQLKFKLTHIFRYRFPSYCNIRPE